MHMVTTKNAQVTASLLAILKPLALAWWQQVVNRLDASWFVKSFYPQLWYSLFKQFIFQVREYQAVSSLIWCKLMKPTGFRQLDDKLASSCWNCMAAFNGASHRITGCKTVLRLAKKQWWIKLSEVKNLLKNEKFSWVNAWRKIEKGRKWY